MKGNTPGRAGFPWRALLYGLILLYLVADLFWLGGPLRQKIDSRKPYSKYARQQALEHGWVATVNGEPVTQRQLDRTVEVYLYRRGKSLNGISELDLRLARLSAMRELVQDVLVRQHTRAENFVADTEALERRVKQFEAQFPDAEELEERSAALGLEPEERRRLLAENMTGQLWLEHRISPATGVTEAEARKWFEENRESGRGFRTPDVIRARHIFLSTVESDTDEREALIRDIHRELLAGKDFGELAKEFSEDERSKHHGGDLHWFSAERLPRDFLDVAFGMAVGEISEPFRTTIGWHVVQVTDRKEGRVLTYEELEPEILARIESERRRHAVTVFLEKLETASAIAIFPEILYGERSPSPESEPASR